MDLEIQESIREYLGEIGILWGIWSPSWRKILTNDGHSLSVTQRKTIWDICERIEVCNHKLHIYVIIGPLSGVQKQRMTELYKEYEDFGQKVFHHQGTMDWRKVEENLKRISVEQDTVRRVPSGSWRQILTTRGHSLTDTQRKTILDICTYIEINNDDDWFDFIGHDGETKRRLSDLYKEYEKLGQKVLNNPDTPDWKNIEEALNRILGEQRLVRNNDTPDWKYIEEALNRILGEQRLVRNNASVFPRRIGFSTTLAMDDRRNGLSFKQDQTEKTGKSICVEELHGQEYVFDNVKSSDSVGELMSRIERKTKVPKHELVLICNGKKMEETHFVKDYDIDDTSSILLIRHRRKDCVIMGQTDIITWFWRRYSLATRALQGIGKREVTSYNLREIVMNKFYQLYDEIGNLFKKFPQVFQDTTHILTEKDFSRIAQAIGDGWQFLGMELGLDRVKLEHITANNQTVEMKIFDMMIQWSRQTPFEATAGRLYNAIQNCSKVSCNLETLNSIVFGIANI